MMHLCHESNGNGENDDNIQGNLHGHYEEFCFNLSFKCNAKGSRCNSHQRTGQVNSNANPPIDGALTEGAVG